MHELIAEHDVVVANTLTRNVVVLTPVGAVFDALDTSDVLNLSVAYGALFDNNWRRATAGEFQQIRSGRRLVELTWVDPNAIKLPLTSRPS